jgi:hypothetical protein
VHTPYANLSVPDTVLLTEAGRTHVHASVQGADIWEDAVVWVGPQLLLIVHHLLPVRPRVAELVHHEGLDAFFRHL